MNEEAIQSLLADDSDVGSQCTADECNFETVMQDESVDYVMVPSTSPQIMEQRTELKEKKEPGYVVVPDDSANSSGSWLSRLKSHLFLTSQRNGLWVRSFISNYFVASASLNHSTSTIHGCYDWVSDVSIDGGKLILPGQLISFDEPTNFAVSERGIVDSSTIMVSAHDLLAVQTQISRQGGGREPLNSPDSNLPRSSTLFGTARKVTVRWITSTATLVNLGTFTVSSNIGSRLANWEQHTGLVACAAGWMHQMLDSYFPEPEFQAGNAKEDLGNPGRISIELSTRNITGKSTEGPAGEVQ